MLLDIMEKFWETKPEFHYISRNDVFIELLIAAVQVFEALNPKTYPYNFDDSYFGLKKAREDAENKNNSSASDQSALAGSQAGSLSNTVSSIGANETIHESN